MGKLFEENNRGRSYFISFSKVILDGFKCKIGII